MKSISLRRFFVTCLCVASLCSFLYINLGVTQDTSLSDTARSEIYSVEADSSETKILLPDLEILEQAIKKGKRHLEMLSRFQN